MPSCFPLRHGVFLDPFNEVLVPLLLLLAAGELFSHDIDLPAARLIGRLGRVQHDALVLHDGVVSLLLDAVLLLLESGRLASLDVLLTLL